MTPGSWNITSSTASSEPVFTAGGRTRVLELRRSARARRMRLAIDPRDGAVRLTLPPRASVAKAMAWAESQRAWIEAALAALPAEAPLGPGLVVPLLGVDHVVDWDESRSRIVRVADGRIEVGGPGALVGGRVLRWLKAQARMRLEAETARFAAIAGVAIGRVRLGDPQSRWGSCSSRGDIAYSWRLILMPAAVLEATVAHEVAHRLHMHHGPEFHAEVAHLLGREPKAERAWLRANGARVQAFGRG